MNKIFNYFLILILIVFTFSCSSDKIKNNKPLTNQNLQNLKAFTKLYGYIRFFHPGSEAQKIDWDKFAVYGAALAENAKNTGELLKILNELFMPIAPLLKIYETNNPEQLNSNDLIQGGTSVVFWQHFGVGLKDQSYYKLYFSKIDSFNTQDSIFGNLSKYPKPNEYFTEKINDELTVSFPLALYLDKEKTLPAVNENSFNTLIRDVENYETNNSVNYRAVRFGCIIITWNILQHFYPYFDVVNPDWQKALNESLISAAKDSTETSFVNTLRKLTAVLNDGHIYLEEKNNDEIYSPSFEWDWIERNIIITNVLDSLTGLKPGDKILEINGVKTEDALKHEEDYISGATGEFKKFIYANNGSVKSVLSGTKNSALLLKISSINGSISEVKVTRKEIRNHTQKYPEAKKFDKLKNDIMYVNLTQANMYEINEKMPELEKAKGIIFDLRGYPNGNHEIIQHLIDTNVMSAIWTVPLTVFPDRQNVEFSIRGRWDLEPKSPRLKAKIVFITDARAISYAESFMGIIEAYKLAEIVGEPTAGTNGNVNVIYLPNGYTIPWTGMRVIKHDGSGHHGIGILPTIPCSRTIKGVLDSRDELLEKAIEVVSMKK